MGRRKIEIQPITHERNRSVTFLKRKNGLFKKAYELGVLCSVDVAVIIFEERAGHHVKLYQYCSGDVDNMVQRHIHFDGERDLKTPTDFSNTKADEAGDDEDEVEEEDGARTNQKKDKPVQQAAIAPKTSPSHSNGASHGNVPIRPAQSIPDSNRHDMDFRGSSSSRHASGSGMNGVPILPISNERQSSSSSRSLNMSGLVNGNNISMPLSMPIPTISQSHKRQRLDAPVIPPPGLQYPYRLDVDLSTYPPAAHATSLGSNQSPQHSRNPQGSLSLPFPQSSMGMGMGMQNDSFSSQSPFEFPSSRRSMTYSGQSSGSFGGGSGSSGGMNGMFGARPGPQTTNMLMDLLNSTAGADVGASFEWPGSPAGGTLDAGTGTSDSASWLEFLAGAGAGGTPQSAHPSALASPGGGALALGLPTPTASRAASNSVSSTASAYAGCRSPQRKRSRDDGCGADDAGSGILKAMKLEDGRRSVG